MKKRLLFIFFFCCVCSTVFYAKKFYRRPDLTVAGFIHLGDGLGRQSAELIDAFSNEFTINFVPTRKEKGTKIPNQFQKLFKSNKEKWGKVLIFEDLLWRPNKELFKKILPSDSIRIAYSVWESTHIPPEWVQILNTHFDATIVPSPFLVEAYKNSGVTIPIFELPLALNLDPFLSQPLKEKPNHPFIFGNLSACSDRKNQLLLIRAFAKAFGNDPNVCLRINARYGEKEVSNAITYEIAKLNLTNIIFTQFALPQEEYLSLFKTIDCYVSPSKGEGFSIQPREAMALGIPVIAADNTGQRVICNSGLVKAIHSPLKEIALYPWGDSYGYNFNCEEEELVRALKEVKENYLTYLVKGAASREWVQQYQYKNLKSFYRAFIKPKTILLGEENKVTENGLITNSPKLYHKYANSNS